MEGLVFQAMGALVVIAPLALGCIYYAWKDHQSDKIDLMWDGKPWDEAEYQRRVKEWEKEKRSG